MTVPTSQSAWHGWRLFAVLAVAVLCMTALVLALQAQPVEGLRSAIRATARSSFALFLRAVPRRFPRVLAGDPVARPGDPRAAP